MSVIPPRLTFPHPELTIVEGEPTNSSIQVLQRELYANARAIHSTRGGGAHGYLALLMPDADYLALTNIAFVAPVHPGDTPIHAAGATQPQISEANRQYLHDLTVHTEYMTVSHELKKGIIAAVDNKYLEILEDADMGYADVTCAQMLSHLKTTYGSIVREDIDKNRNILSAPWNVDNPMEELWLRIKECQRIATAAGEPILDGTAIRLTLTVLEATGVYSWAVDKWRDLPDAQWTLVNFKNHFSKANKERIRQLTARAAGYHGANMTTDIPSSLSVPTTSTPSELAAAAIVTPPTNPTRARRSSTASTPSVTTNGVSMYYCWTHGLGMNAEHTSATCSRKGDGHVDNATATNMQGGNNRIMTMRPRRSFGTSTAGS